NLRNGKPVIVNPSERPSVGPRASIESLRGNPGKAWTPRVNPSERFSAGHVSPLESFRRIPERAWTLPPILRNDFRSPDRPDPKPATQSLGARSLAAARPAAPDHRLDLVGTDM